MSLKIKQDTGMDCQEIETVIKQAFASSKMSDQKEHHFVARLRESEHFLPELSLIAQINNKIVGHVMLTKNKIVQGKMSIESLTLAPVFRFTKLSMSRNWYPACRKSLISSQRTRF